MQVHYFYEVKPILTNVLKGHVIEMIAKLLDSFGMGAAHCPESYSEAPVSVRATQLKCI